VQEDAELDALGAATRQATSKLRKQLHTAVSLGQGARGALHFTTAPPPERAAVLQPAAHLTTSVAAATASRQLAEEHARAAAQAALAAATSASDAEREALSAQAERRELAGFAERLSAELARLPHLPAGHFRDSRPRRAEPEPGQNERKLRRWASSLAAQEAAAASERRRLECAWAELFSGLRELEIAHQIALHIAEEGAAQLAVAQAMVNRRSRQRNAGANDCPQWEPLSAHREREAAVAERVQEGLEAVRGASLRQRELLGRLQQEEGIMQGSSVGGAGCTL